MPIYEYRCEQGHTFEVMQRISDDPVSTCTTCSAPVQRVFHPVAVHFKGSGFYNTDYGTRKRQREQKENGDGKASEGSGSSESKGGGESGGGGESSSGKSESKPAESKKPDSKATAA